MQPESGNPTEQSVVDVSQPVHWQSNEYIHHDRSVAWFIVFGLTTVILTALALFLLNSITFAILIPVMAVALFTYVRRPPRVLDYSLSKKGLYINDQLYSFDQFKGFGITTTHNDCSLTLIPVKRFKPAISVYFPEESGEIIVDTIGIQLPIIKVEPDFIDRITHKLRI